MKIIKIDNFDRDSVPDELIADNVRPEFGPCMTLALNTKYSGPDSPFFFMVIPDDYKLKVVEA